MPHQPPSRVGVVGACQYLGTRPVGRAGPLNFPRRYYCVFIGSPGLRIRALLCLGQGDAWMPGCDDAMLPGRIKGPRIDSCDDPGMQKDAKGGKRVVGSTFWKLYDSFVTRRGSWSKAAKTESRKISPWLHYVTNNLILRHCVKLSLNRWLPLT